MSRLEDLLAQIFDRKDRIVHRLGQQVQSYNESVAINFAATGGGTPPPWLWSPGAGSEALALSLTQGFGCPFPSSSGCPPVRPEFPFCRNSDVVFSVGDLRQNVDMNPVFMAPSIKNDVDGCVRQSEDDESNMEHIVGENGGIKCCTSRDGNAEGCSGCKMRSTDSSVKVDFEKGVLGSGICSGRETRSRKLSAQLGTENQILGSNDCAVRVTRSRTSSAKLELEKRSLHANGNQDGILQDLSNKVLPGSKQVRSKNANMEQFPAKDGFHNNAIGCVTGSRNSSVKLDFEKQSTDAKKGAIFPVEYGHAVDKSSSTGNFLTKVIDEVNDSDKNDVYNENAGHNFLIKDVSGKVPLRVEHKDMHSCTQGPNESAAQATNTGHGKGYCLSSSGNNRKVMIAVDDKSSVVTFNDRVVEHEGKTDASPMQDALSEAKYFSRSSFSHISGSAKSVSDYAEMISPGNDSMPLDEQELGASNVEKVESDKCSIEQTVRPGEFRNPSEPEQCITRDSNGNGNNIGELPPDDREDMCFSDSSGSSGEHIPRKNIKDGAEDDFLPSESQYFLGCSMKNDNATSLDSHGSDDSCFSKRKAIPCACNMTWPKWKRMGNPVDDILCTSQGLRPSHHQNANQCRSKSSVYTSDCAIQLHHFRMPKKSTHQIVNSTQSTPFENMQKKMIHHKIENVATDITRAIPDLEVSHSYHDVDLFHKSMSEPVFSSFASYKEEMQDGLSSKQVNLCSQMGDGTTINEPVLHSEEKGEVITDITGAVPDLMKHHAPDNDIDLLYRHTSQLFDSDCSIDLVGAIQNGRSHGEEDFFSQLGGTSANLATISHVERMEGKEIASDTLLKMRNEAVLDYRTENASSVYLGHSGREMEDKIPFSEVNFSSNGSFKSMHQEKESLGVPVQMSSELEGSSIGASSEMVGYDFIKNSQFPTSALDSDKLLEKLNTSTAVMTPNCLSSKHEIHRISEASHSLPDDLPLHSNFTNFLNMDDVRQHWSSEYCKMFDTCKSITRNGSTQIVPSSQHMFSTGSLCASDAQRPFTPIEKYPHKRTSSKSGSSSDQMANPELICFRIDENASITGDEILDELEEIPQPRLSSSEVVVSTNNKTLTDMTSLVQNASTMFSTSQKCLDRGSLDSVNTEADMEVDRNDIQHIVDTNIHSKRSGIKRKNQSLSASMKKAGGSKSIQNRLGKTKPSLRVRNQHKSQASARKGPSNIVSNVSSFIPLIQQKQQTAAPLHGRRDIKVKALEAAEAAKRQIEKREKVRKMKKEAAMLERKKLEEEKLRNAELERKKKEEEKRKEARIAARKRQREEDEKKEKRVKQRCGEQTFRQNKEQDRICSEDKDLHSNAAEQMVEDTRKCLSSVNTQESAEANKVMEVNQIIGVKCGQGIGDAFNIKNANGKMSNSSSMNEETCNQLTRKDSHESQSYEISPYIDSDVEDEDGIPRRQPIPFWARRESLDHLLHSQRHIDGRKIFSCKSSFRLSKVLSVRQRPRPFAQI